MKKKKITDNTLKSFLVSLGISALSLLAVAFVMALVAYSMENPTGNVALLSLVSLILSAIISGVVISRITGDGGTRLVALSSLALMLILLLVGLVIKRGGVSSAAFMNYACFVGVSALAAYLGRKSENRRRRRR